MTKTTEAPKQKMVGLYSYTNQEPISLRQAITNCVELLDGAIGLFYSPKHCCFGKISSQEQGLVTWYELQQGKAISWQQKTLDWDSVFEARIFTEVIELRWLNVPNQGGQAVLLREQKIDTTSFKHKLPVLEKLHPHSQTYLLWGEGLGEDAAPAEGWSTLATARIGMMAVPIANVEHHQSVLLESREYFGIATGIAGEQHGNVSVVEERLVGLRLGVKNGEQ